MKDTLNPQAEIIDRARQVGYPLEKIVYPLGIPVIFSDEPHSLTFHELDLDANDLKALVPQVSVSDEYKYQHALVVKRNNEPMVAFCTGIASRTPDALPIAAIFNLTEPSQLKVLLLAGNKSIRSLENSHVPAGGLGLSRLLRGNPDRELVRVVSNRFSFLIDARR